MISRLHIIILATLALVVPLIYWPGIYDFTLHPRLLVIQIGILSIAITLIFRSEGAHRHSSIFLPLLAFTAWSTLSVIWAINPLESLVQINRTVTFALLTLLVPHILDRSDIPKVYGWAGIACIAISIIGIAQYFGIPLPWNLHDHPTVGNPSATFGYRNFAASYLVISIPFAIAFAATATHLSSRLGWSLSAVLMTIFLAYTRTRGAWLGLAVALTIAAITIAILRLCYHKSLFHLTLKQFAIITACIVLVGSLASLPAQMEQEGKFRFDERKTDVATTLAATFSPSDARGRLIVWQHTLEMVLDHPLLGVGIGSWQYMYPRYDQGDWITHNVAPQRPHNDLLWIFSETGLIGLSLYIWLLITLGYITWQHLLQHPNRSETIWIFGIAIGLIALTGHSFFSFPRERIAPSFMFWLGIGTIATLTSQPSQASRRWQWVIAIPTLCCGLILTYSHLHFDKYYWQTYDAWRRENWPRLITEADAALQWGAFNHRVLLLKGLAFQKQGQYQNAANTYGIAQFYHPNEGHAALASAYTALGQHKKAVDHYRIESLLYPNLATASSDLGDALMAAGNPSEAISAYRLATTLSPRLFNAWLGLGNANQLMNIWDAAHKAYTYAQALSPKDPRVYNNLGAVLFQRQQFNEAEAAYLHALKLKPGYVRVHHNLGDLYTAKGDTVKAIAAYRTFIRTWQGDTRFAKLAQTKVQNLNKTP